MIPNIKIIGAGLSGCEAAWQCARRGVEIELYEMRPVRSTPAHQTDKFAELVCSNSLKSESENTAPWLLKEEMRRSGSLLLRIAQETSVPAGHALAVDRETFASRVTEVLAAEPKIKIVREEATTIAENDGRGNFTQRDFVMTGGLPEPGTGDAQTGFSFSLNNRPIDRARSAIPRQQRRVILDRSVRGNVEKIFRHEQRNECHYLEIGLERAEFLPHRGIAIGRRLIHRQLRRDVGRASETDRVCCSRTDPGPNLPPDRAPLLKPLDPIEAPEPADDG